MPVAASGLTYTHTTLSVTTSSQEAKALNNSRRYLLLINNSDTDIYVKVGATAVANEGIRLNANGGNFEMHQGADNIDFRAVNAIHGGTGSKTLLVTEGV